MNLTSPSLVGIVRGVAPGMGVAVAAVLIGKVPEPVWIGTLLVAGAAILQTGASRFLAGLGVGLLVFAAGSYGPRNHLDGSVAAGLQPGPVVIRGWLKPQSFGADRWGRYRFRLLPTTVVDGDGARPFHDPVEVRTSEALQAGRVRLKARVSLVGAQAGEIDVKSHRLVEYEGSAKEPTAGIRARFRRWVAVAVDEFELEPTHRALFESIVLGRREALDPEISTAFRRLGLGHLFAVSGLHLGCVAALAWSLGAWCGRYRRWLVLAVIVAYTTILDPRGSVLRAAAVLLVWQLAEGLGRRVGGLTVLTTAVGCLLLSSPGWIEDLGFQLSVLAVLGILLLGVPLIRARRTRLGTRLGTRSGTRPTWLGSALAIGVGAQVFTLPLAGARFHWLAPLAPLWGLVAIPWAGVLIAIGIPALVVAAAVPRIGPVVGSLLSPWLAIGLETASIPPGWGGGFPISTKLSLFYAIGLAAAVLAQLVTPRFRLGLRVVAAILLIASLIPGPGVDRFRIHFLDVGQGDAILLRDRSGEATLIDGGSSVSRLLELFADLHVRRLERVVVTHPDRDHCGGIAGVLGWLSVKEVWVAPGWDAECYWQVLRHPHATVRPLWRGREFAGPGWSVRALAPYPSGTRVDNDDSLVLLLNAVGSRVLLTGDIEYRGESRVVRETKCLDLKAEFLKVAHHGSSSSSSKKILDCVRPDVAVISAAQTNSFGHPSPTVVERLRRQGARVLVTGEVGTVTFELD